MRHSEQNPDIEALLDYIKRSRGFDFTGYKRSSLLRRIAKRMQTVNIESYTDYLAFLEAHPSEFNQLFNTLLINVTAFFRDRPAWDYIASEVVPQTLERKAEREPIRVWSAGCASGQEAYTIAILLAEMIGIEQFRDRVKIYATDVDEEALNQARQATYTTLQHICMFLCFFCPHGNPSQKSKSCYVRSSVCRAGRRSRETCRCAEAGFVAAD